MTTDSGNPAAELDLFEDEATGKPATAEKSSTIPDKYSGKTVEDLIKMHQNAERKISEQGQEVSTLRRMSDEILNLKATKPETQKREERQPVTVEQLLNDPEKALKSAVDGSDLAHRARAAEERVASLEAKITEREFVSAHPSYTKDAQDPEFIAWVQKNALRQALGNEAAKSNFAAAKNLWDLWEEHRELTGARTTETTDEAKPRAKVPSTVKSSPQGTQANRTYSRAKLMELRMKVEDGDPLATARWKDPEFQRNMIEAYAAGRVK